MQILDDGRSLVPWVCASSCTDQACSPGRQIRERRQSVEEFASYAETFAREHHELHAAVARDEVLAKVRQVTSLMAYSCPPTSVRPWPRTYPSRTALLVGRLDAARNLSLESPDPVCSARRNTAKIRTWVTQALPSGEDRRNDH
jgi:hypothetical protein